MKAGVSGIRRQALRLLLLALALAVALPAFALGLGRIVVKSAPGQPLLAEIPIVSSDSSELRNLQVRLASPETFLRVGLPVPDAVAANLRFDVAVDERGQPVIRVSSEAPLSQPLLTFLIEVDWGAGRLVREYSVLLDAPTALAAQAQPIQAATVAAPDTIVREPAPVPVPPTAEPETESATTAPDAPPPAAAEPPAPAPAASPPPPSAMPPTPVPTPVPVAGAARQAATAAGSYTIRAGDTLSGIAAGLDRGGRSLDQMMLALLQANPEAFIGGNINLIRTGAVLRAPSADALARYSRGEAAALVRRHVAEWRQAAAARMPAGAAIADAASASAAATPPLAGEGAGRTDGPRLQIVPPAEGKGAGTQSGAQAGGEGRNLRQEIQESRETIAARDAELGELRTRVAELEKIRQQQQQLIEMKDTALATARADLANAQQQQPAAPAQPAPVPASAAAYWPWLAAILLLAMLAGLWWWRRGKGRRQPFVAPRAPVPPAPASVTPTQEPEPEPEPAATATPAPPPPHWTASPAQVGGMPPASEPSPPDEGMSPARQIELARACLDLGDEPAARALLGEAAGSDDPIAREIATRMLRELR